MEEKTIEKNGEMEVDLQRLLGSILKQSWLIVLVSVACAAAALVGSLLLITPKYESKAMFYVNNSALSVGDAALSISSGDLGTSRDLVESYIVILNTRTSLVDIIDYAGVNRTVKELEKMIEASSVNETEIFQVVVTSPDPQEAEKIANAIAYILPKRITNIIEGTSAKIVDSAVVATKPSSPSYMNNTLLGFLIGFVMVIAVIVLREIFDVSIRSEKDITQVCKHPVLAQVPDMTAPGKGGEYGYGRKTVSAAQSKQPALLGESVSFAAAESYKLLRTKLQFSFVEGEGCRVIGITSAISGEGKSVSAINLAYTLSQLNQKVLLIDCDMRRPTVAEKLNIRKKPGLSSLLTGQSGLENLIQLCGLPGSEDAFHVIAADQNPPNPVELLSSARMRKLLAQLRKHYDYIILDLPPVCEVSDAIAVAKELDGMLLVVRQNYCNRLILSDTIHQIEFVGAKILGVVYNFAEEGNWKGKKKYYYKQNREAAGSKSSKAASGKR